MYISRRLIAAIGMPIMLGSGGVMVSTPSAQAASTNAYGASASSNAVPALKGSYNFCNPNSCPLTSWILGAHHTFTDGLGNNGTYTVSGVKKNKFVFTIADVGGGISCTFNGKKTTAGFNTVAKPGPYTCTDGTDTTWWATKS
jgi:hypothetical protein